jgi:hypothetical protein
MLRLGQASGQTAGQPTMERQRFMTTDLEKNISFLEMDNRRKNATYSLLNIQSCVQIGEQINVLADISGTSF